MGEVKVVLALDGSEISHQALEYYLDVIHKDSYHVILVNDIELPGTANEARQKMLSGEALKGMWEEQTKGAKALEMKYAKHLQDRGVHHVKIKLEGGLNPGLTICKVASDEHASMIVMGCRGQGVLRRTIIGSVSDYVLHHAHCPVVVYKAAHQKKEK
jgi:nucleotide-binding universal stress UspA family protein